MLECASNSMLRFIYMVMTVLEAKVEPGMWQMLRKTYASLTANVPPEIKASYLLQEQKDKNYWQIVTIWRDNAALVAMRRSEKTPIGVLIFNKVGAEPTLTIFDISKVAMPT